MSSTTNYQPFIELSNVSLHLQNKALLKDVNCTFNRQECVAIIGSSGAGKSTLLQLLIGLNIEHISGSCTLKSVKDQYSVQFLPQGQSDNLNPKRTVEQHFIEQIVITRKEGFLSKLKGNRHRAELVQLVQHLSLSEEILSRYPASLSGGEIQRVLLGLTLLAKPQLLLLDEPTAALDRLTKKHISAKLKECKQHSSIIIVSHDMELVRDIADRIVVMKQGKIIQDDQASNIIFDSKNRDNELNKKSNAYSKEELLSIDKLNLSYADKQIFSDFSLSISKGSTHLVYGRSGSGKTQLARIIAQWKKLPDGARYRMKGSCALLSQHALSACASHFSLQDILFEPLRLMGKDIDKEKMYFWLKQVSLPTTEAFLQRKPTTLSGGELQRLLLVRAMLIEPDLLIADEPTSALDPALRDEIISLFNLIHQYTGCALLIFTHDPEMAEVMQQPRYRLNKKGLIKLP